MPTTFTATREDLTAQRGPYNLLSTWLPVVIGLIIIMGESTRTMSSAHTSSFLRPIFARLFGPMSDAHWDIFHHALRKSGHFCGYGTFGLCWLRAWLRTFAARLQWTQSAWRLRSAALAIAGTFLSASADEFHQTFLPGRTGQFSDVLLDTAGSVLFLLIVSLFWRRKAQ